MNGTTLCAFLLALLFGIACGPVQPALAEPHKAAVTPLKDTEFVGALLPGIRNSRKSIVCSYYLLFDTPDVVTHLMVTVIDSRYIFSGTTN